ncbi:LamG-like jellyroll fold domain-containing protein [Polaromonas sp.]|uniref:RHS repeat domain-containing protein n=1 Tax=Polaromonas sp. TaxID=1869339 RepID=UPI0032658025
MLMRWLQKCAPALREGFRSKIAQQLVLPLQSGNGPTGISAWLGSSHKDKSLSAYRARFSEIALFVIFSAGPMGSAFAAPSDCAGTSLDGQAACILPTYAPTTYSYCVQTGFAHPENAMANCSNSLGYTRPYTSSGQLESILNCAIAPNTYPGPAPWAATGETVGDGNLCGKITASVVNGVNVRGGARTNPNWGWNVIFYRYTEPSCPTGYSSVTQMINGVNELVSCKPVVSGTNCAADKKRNIALDACVLEVDIYRDAPKPVQPSSCPVLQGDPKASDLRNPGVGDPIYPLTGVNRHPVETGFGIGSESLHLTYDTARQLSGLTAGNLPSFGRLWVSNLHRNLSISTDAVAIKAYRGNGGMLTFVLKAGVYTPDRDINDRIAAVSGGYAYTNAIEKKVELYNAAGQLTSITDSSGRTLSFTYSTSGSATAPAAGYLMQITANTGRALKFEYSLAAGVNPVLDGRISKITDANGDFITVAYDANGNLSSITWPDTKTRQFLYELAALPWALTGVIDENNSRFLTFTYDSQGLATSTEQAGGVDRYSVSYASPPSRVVTEVLDTVAKIEYRYHEIQPPTSVALTRPMGQSSSWSAVNSIGSPVITGSSQPAGSGCAAASSATTYDANGNMLSRDNFQGERSCYVYDSSNRQTLRVEGLATTTSCSSVTPSDATLPAGARRIITMWHPDWRMPTKILSPGKLETVVYHGRPDFLNSNALASCSSAANLPNAKPLPLICRHVEQDVTGATLPSITDPVFADVSVLLHGDGINNSTSFVESSQSPKAVTVIAGLPKISTAQSKFGGASIYFPGSAALAVNGASANTFWTSDWTVEFWVLSAVAAQSPAAVFGSRWPDGGAQLYLGYSASVLTNITYEIRENGSLAGFGVNSTTPGFAAAVAAAGSFNHVAVTKVGKTYGFFLNGVMLPAIVRAVQPNNTTNSVMFVGSANPYWYGYGINGYLDDFRITMGAPRYTASFTPPTSALLDGSLDVGTNVPTRMDAFTYDASGRVLTNTDTLNRTTAYAYYTATAFTGSAPNEVGHTTGDLQSITNAAGHITQFTQYDRAGRVRQMIDPKGVVTDTVYTPRGWVASTTVTPPGGAARTTSYSYDNAGQLTGVVLPDTTTLSYSYDLAHRLTGVTDAKGNTVTYTLDNMGNRVGEQVKDPQGNLQRNITRVYDALNRVQQITGASN